MNLLTIEECRFYLPESYKDVSEQEIKRIRDDLCRLAAFVIKSEEKKS